MPNKLTIDRNRAGSILENHKAFILWTWMQLRAMNKESTVNISGNQLQLKPGQLVMTLRDAEVATKLSLYHVKSSLSWLISHGHVDNKKHPRFHVITLHNYIIDRVPLKSVEHNSASTGRTIYDSRVGERVYIPAFLEPYFEAYRRKMGGDPLKIKEFCDTMRGLHKRHGEAEVIHRMEAYLSSVEPKFLSITSFGATFKGWGKKVSDTKKWWKKTTHGVTLYYHQDLDHPVIGKEDFIERFPELTEEV